MSTTPKTVYQINVTLIGSKPPVWRRFLVPATTTLSRLHSILQTVMGWQDYHLHMFTIKGRTRTRYGFKSKELVEIRLTAFGKGLLGIL